MSETALLFISGTVRGAVVLAFGLLISCLIPRRSASLQHIILGAALAAQIAIPLAMITAPRGMAMLVPEEITSVVARTMTQMTSAAPFLGAESGVTTTPGYKSAGLATIGITVWITGIVLFGLWMIYGRLYLRRITSRLRPIRSGQVFDALNAAADKLKVQRPVTLFEDTSFSVPVTWGTVYPVVLMPPGSIDWPDERIRMSVLHETAHIVRRDSFVDTVARIVAVLTWFNPLVWVTLRRLRLAAERAADDVVVTCGVDPAQYVDTLLEMLKSAKRVSPVLSASFAMARRSDFETRMMSVLDDRHSRGRAGKTSIVFAGLVFTLVTALAAAAPNRRARFDAVAKTPAFQDNASVWIVATRRARGDIERLGYLQKAIQSRQVTSSDIDSYLDIVATMTNPIPTEEAIVALAGLPLRNKSQVSRLLGLAGNIDAPVPRTVAMNAVARLRDL